MKSNTNKYFNAQRRHLNNKILKDRVKWYWSQPTGSLCCGSNREMHTEYRKPLEKKGQNGQPLGEREGERASESTLKRLTPARTGFYCFSGHITLRMILIYHVWVHCSWLHFKYNQGQNAVNYFKGKDVTAQGGK